MSLFHKNYPTAKLNITFMIMLSATSPVQQQMLHFAVTKWQKNVDDKHIPSMLATSAKNKKNIDYYFSPYTFNNFLQYVSLMVNNGTIIPHTHKMEFNGLRTNISFYENVWQRDKKKQIVMHNGKACITQQRLIVPLPSKFTTGSSISKYADVPIANYTDHVSLLIYQILFFSFNRSQMDRLKSLRAVYDRLNKIAKEFRDQYQMEYKQVHNKKLSVKQMAHVPTYEQFSERNSKAVYIPILTTKRAKKIIDKPHTDYDKNVFNLGEREGDSKKAIKQMHDVRNEQKLNQAVTKKYSRARRDAALKKRNAEIRKTRLTSQEKMYKKKAKALQAKKDQANFRNKIKKMTQSSGSTSTSAPANSLQAKIKARMNDVSKPTSQSKKGSNSSVASAKSAKASSKASSVTSSSSSNDETFAKKAQELEKRKQYKEKKKQADSEKAEQKSAKAKKSQEVKSQAVAKSKSKASNANSKAQRELQVSKPQNPQQAFDDQHRKMWNIDYSSIKEPWVFTNDKATLLQVIKSYFALKTTPKLVKFQRFPVSEHKQKLPNDLKGALKSGKLTNQRYVEINEDNFKRIANAFLSNEEQAVNITEQRNESNMMVQASQELRKAIPKVVGLFRNNKTLKDNAIKYFKENYYSMIKKLHKEENELIAGKKKALTLQYKAELKNSIAQIQGSISTQERQLERILNRNTNFVYNDGRARRNQAIEKKIRNTKSSILKDIVNNMQARRASLQHTAMMIGTKMFEHFDARLSKARKVWIHTISLMLKDQIKASNAQVQLKKLSVQNKYGNVNSLQNKQLEDKLTHLSEYVKHVEADYDKLQKSIYTRSTKIMDMSSENTRLHAKIRQLQLDQNNDQSQLNTTLNQYKYKNEQLQHTITDKNQNIADLHKLNTKIRNNADNLESSNGMTSSQLKSLKADKAQLNTRISSLLSDKSSLMTDRDDLSSKYQSQKTSMENKQLSERTDIQNKYEDKLTNANHQLSQAQSKNIDYKQKIADYQARISTLKSANQQKSNTGKNTVLRTALHKANTQRTNAQTENEKNKTRIAQLQQQLKDVQIQLKQKPKVKTQKVSTGVSASQLHQIAKSAASEATSIADTKWQKELSDKQNQITQLQASSASSAPSKAMADNNTTKAKNGMTEKELEQYNALKNKFKNQVPQSHGHQKTTMTQIDGIPVVGAKSGTAYPDALSQFKPNNSSSDIAELHQDMKKIMEEMQKKNSKHRWWRKN